MSVSSMTKYDTCKVGAICAFYSGKKDCLEWEYSRTPDGYGQLRKGMEMKKAHRIAYEEVVGEIPKGKVVRHTCHNPCCYNPNHLKLGTIQDNSDDMVKAGRQARGADNGRAVLTKEDVDTMREIRLKEGMSYPKLAELFGVSMSQTYRICKGDQWRS